MYYQQYNGPLNYELDSSNGLIQLEHNDYPLISVITKPIPSVTEFSSTIITMLPCHSTSLHYTTLSSTTNTLLSSVSSSSSSINAITPSPTLSTTESITTPLSSIEFTRTQNTVSRGNSTSEVSVTSSSSATATKLNTTSMESTPDQSTGSLILAGSTSSVFILLVVTILVILIVSVLVCRRKQLGTGNTNSNSERIVDEQKQDERQNVFSSSANAAYGVIGQNENNIYSNPAYGINTVMTQSINEELLVYDEPLVYDKPRTMNNELEVIVMPAHKETCTQQKEEELCI
ncbi:PREDICTED: uncharacterized serine-rich protein C215.13-like [Amphimedon queenslandica]|uniref:Uncharacterized protein n=1 Tax=Amphimedon queenslandica TaxID=400682 RepID=A0AAN0JLI9_AMPQE|nr:PREDICTED: uncharacterized serine-rich protein C215.13-like [Amphimedon queenslandica]|eukprot:XP_019857857.1 PREDICTED: uncharacterized serine-rich protein C215.13-like [Amphimedon queenslandica]